MLDFRSYIENADLYAAEAADEAQEHVRKPLIVVATILSWCAVEAFVNSMLEDFASVEHLFDLHEKGLLLEKKVAFRDTGDEAGKFELEGKDYWKIEHKIMFLVSKFGTGMGSSNLNKGQNLWREFQVFKKARDSIVHPRPDDAELAVEDVEGYIGTAKQVIQSLGLEVWKQEVQF